MAKRDLLRDSSSFASGELDYILRAEHTKKTAGPSVTVDEAMRGSRLVKHHSVRNVTRVLFISQDTALLNPSQQTLDGYIKVADMFDEVHILVLRTGLPPRQPVLRPEKNVWIYTVATTYWWQLPVAAQTMLEAQLLFADGFRPDIIVARDPVESAVIALRASAAYGRPAQLHVTDNAHTKASWPQRLIARYAIPKFTSVRVTDQHIWSSIERRVTTKDFAILPRLNPYESILQVRQTIDLRQLYPQYIFTMLFVGQLETGSTILEVLNAAQQMLQNSSVALIVVGEGSLLSDCKRRAKALGIEKQIIYLPSDVDIVQYLKAAHILFVTDTDAQSEDIALQAAYAQIPMILSNTDRRTDLFTHLESAFLCELHDTETLAKGLSVLMNDVSLRQHITEQALAVAQAYFHRDPQQYQRLYRASIEVALFPAEAVELSTDPVNNGVS